MITECYIKGRYDYGVGKCAVVITEDVPRGQEKVVLHQTSWAVPAEWQYAGVKIMADQFNCEILAACYALNWCMQNGKGLVNIYANTQTAYKWYSLLDFPDARAVMSSAYIDMARKYCEYVDSKFGHQAGDVISADTIPKNTTSEQYGQFNALVNQLAENVR